MNLCKPRSDGMILASWTTHERGMSSGEEQHEVFSKRNVFRDSAVVDRVSDRG
jgi:hypothetical protein